MAVDCVYGLLVSPVRKTTGKFPHEMLVIFAVSAARVTVEFSSTFNIGRQMNINTKVKMWEKIKGNSL